MAIAQFTSSAVVALNGSVGNTTYARNKYGMYAKTKIGEPAGSSFLTAWQTQVGVISDTWSSGMSEADRLSWYQVHRTEYNDLAQLIVITGFDLFMSVNLNLFLAGSAAVILPPGNTRPAEISQPSLPSWFPGSLTVLVPAPALQRYLIYASRPLPRGRMSYNQIFAFIQVAAASTMVTDITYSYHARLGVPASGQKIVIRCTPIQQVTGTRGVPQYVSGILS